MARPFKLSFAHSSGTKESPFLSAEFIVLQCKNEVASTSSASSPGEKGPWQPLGLLVSNILEIGMGIHVRGHDLSANRDVGTVQHDGMRKDLGKSTPLQIILASIGIHVLGEADLNPDITVARHRPWAHRRSAATALTKSRPLMHIHCSNSQKPGDCNLALPSST